MLDTVGYEANKRLSASSGNVVDNAGTYVTGLIPFKMNDTIRFKNVTIPADGGYSAMLGFYDADGTYIEGNALASTSKNVTLDANGNVIGFKLDYLPDVAFIRVSAGYIDENSIITVNEPIN